MQTAYYPSHFRLPRTPKYHDHERFALEPSSSGHVPIRLVIPKELLNDSNVLSPLRLELLRNTFESTVDQFRNFRPLLVDIKREYDRTIDALVNLTQEKTYLRSKIQTLICENGSEEQLDHLRGKLVQLSFRNSMVVEENDVLKQSEEDEELNFLLGLARACPASPTDTLDEKQRTILRQKERWDRVERFMQVQGTQEPLFHDLRDRIAEHPERFRNLVEKDSLTDMINRQESPPPPPSIVVSSETTASSPTSELDIQREMLETNTRLLASLVSQTEAEGENLRELVDKIEELKVRTELARSRI
ncbi:hypothetical protein HKX48_004691 [Thoreauomyces humboldtii]|nr:hypothetical protein HKX48_004691 [Thoreauomyces humboldtii]